MIFAGRLPQRQAIGIVAVTQQFLEISGGIRGTDWNQLTTVIGTAPVGFRLAGKLPPPTSTPPNQPLNATALLLAPKPR